MNTEITEMSLRFDESNDPIDAVSFSRFFLFFTEVYSGLVKAEEKCLNLSNKTYKEILTNNEFMDALGEGLNYYRELNNEKLLVSKIKKESPLEICFIGISSALTLAVILSGGKINIGGLKAELPPLGTGIECLMAAFSTKEKSRPNPDYYESLVEQSGNQQLSEQKIEEYQTQMQSKTSGNSN
ncbi:MAG: hypothetical protein KKE08_01770 [Gammaproteobacteria bacterium]|nr:hypothetical protein [Gammaproteobacteria bacterium]MBU2181737.1 hypothetical protein [Gammaproteobacteria bacterium]MBU2206325.1 hypothetical protein [Gammaproteobacteria bacterium]